MVSRSSLLCHSCHRYSSEGYSVWYYTEQVIHPDNHEVIVNSLTKSQTSTITSKSLCSSDSSEMSTILLRNCPCRMSQIHATLPPSSQSILLPPLSLSPSPPGVHSPVPHLSELRLTKSPGEIQLMKKAGQLTAKAFKQAMAATKPGVNEAVLESVFEHSVKSQGAQWMSFPPVVAGGDRATCLHYIANNRDLE